MGTVPPAVVKHKAFSAMYAKERDWKTREDRCNRNGDARSLQKRPKLSGMRLNAAAAMDKTVRTLCFAYLCGLRV